MASQYGNRGRRESIRNFAKRRYGRGSIWDVYRSWSGGGFGCPRRGWSENGGCKKERSKIGEVVGEKFVEVGEVFKDGVVQADGAVATGAVQVGRTGGGK